MADAFHIGFDQPDLQGVIPPTDHPFDPAPAAAPPQTNPTDADWSNFPEARSTSKGPDGDVQSPNSLSNFWSAHTGPQAEPKSDGVDAASMVAPGVTPPAAPAAQAGPSPTIAPSAPDGAGLPTPVDPAPQRPLSADEQMQEWLHPTTPEGKQQASEWDAAHAAMHAAWENDTIFGGLHNATSDAIAEIVDGAKAKLGVTLQDPTRGGYYDEAIQRVVAQQHAQSWGAFFNPMDPEGFFGGGQGFKNAVEKAQMDIFDEKRQALAQKIQGDQAFDRAGENSDALKMLDPETPGAMLGAKYSHAANVAAGQTMDAAGNTVAARVAAFGGGMLGGVRDTVNDLALLAGPGIEPTIAKNFFPLAPKALQVISNITEAGVHQALINMGLSAIAAPEHQAANEARGEEHGLMPALHDIEDAGVMGFLPGAFIHGVKALHEIYTGNGSNPSSSQPMIDEFLRQARGDPPDGPITAAGRAHMDEVHAWERANGHPEGWSYSDIVRDRAAAGEAPAARRAPDNGTELPGPPKLLEGPRPYPKAPDLPPEARNRPSPSSITGEGVLSAEADARAQPPAPAGTPPAEQLRAYTEAVRHGEAPDVMAPPEPPMSAPPAHDANFLPPDHLSGLAKDAPGSNPVPHMAPGESFTHADKPVTAGLTFPARDLRTDATTYQYKRGGDVNGVTDRLGTVRQWSPLSVGNIVVHERLDGNRYVVDGHQRTGLAKRIMDADPSQNISLPGFLFKEADGWTPEDVRAEAAAKNIREGLGDTLDIARILRDKPEIWDDSLPIGRGDMKEARGLANLSPEAWGMVVNGKPRTDFASFVGNMAEDKTTHSAILDDLIKFEPRTQNEARMIIADAMQAGFNKSEQNDLFGTHEVTESLRGERSKVYAAAERLLSSDKKIFGMLDAESSRIIEAGNVLTDTNAERADRAGQLAQGLIKLAQRTGPISAALNRAAQRVAGGDSPKTSARTFLNELPELLKQEGVAVADVAAPPKYDLDTPKGRDEQIADLQAEFMSTQPTMFDEPAPQASTPPQADDTPESIAANIRGALQTGSVDAKRFSVAPTTAQLDEIIENGRTYEDEEADRLFGADAPQVKKWMRSSSDSAATKLVDLIDDKYGSGSPQEGLIYGTGGTNIVNIDSLKALRDTISNIEGAIDDKEMLPRELAWLAPKLPDATKAPDDHSESERIALLGLARAFEDMQANGVDAERVLREAVAYSGHRTGGDADDARVLMEKIVPYVREFMPTAAREAPAPVPALEHPIVTEARTAVADAAAAAKASPDPLDKKIGKFIEKEIAPLILPAAESGPEGTQQTLMPGINPVRDADRAQLGADAPLRGGSAPPPAGGLFDEMAQAQQDFFALTPTEDGLKTREQMQTQVPMETALAKFVKDCQV